MTITNRQSRRVRKLMSKNANPMSLEDYVVRAALTFTAILLCIIYGLLFSSLVELEREIDTIKQQSQLQVPDEELDYWRGLEQIEAQREPEDQDLGGADGVASLHRKR
jgi:hypothetical protein